MNNFFSPYRTLVKKEEEPKMEKKKELKRPRILPWVYLIIFSIEGLVYYYNSCKSVIITSLIINIIIYSIFRIINNIAIIDDIENALKTRIAENQKLLRYMSRELGQDRSVKIISDICCKGVEDARSHYFNL